MARKLGKFSISPADDGFTLHIEDDKGEVLDVAASEEQLELIADTIDDLLAEDDAEDEEA
ncbi:MAG: hypothetical protein M3145_06720 [Pseudomonadota bacterium]|nr:hypothetical protein [Pseudomonadota bacterium]